MIRNVSRLYNECNHVIHNQNETNTRDEITNQRSTSITSNTKYKIKNRGWLNPIKTE